VKFPACDTVIERSGTITVKEAVAVFPALPLVEVTVPVVLTWLPMLTAVAFTEKTHVLIAATEPPASVIDAEPAVAVIVPAPQVPTRPFGFEICSPEGNASVNATPAKATVAFELVMVNVKEVVPPSATLAAPKASAIEGGATTAMLAFEVFPAPPSVDVICTLLFFTPGADPVTFSDTVQPELAARVAAFRLTEPVPAVAVAEPVHVLLRLLGEATTKPAGRLSVNSIPVSASPVFGFAIVKVSELVPFSGTVKAPKDLLIVGGLATASVAEAEPPVPPFVALIGPVLLR
jgi:hypothetical protein